MWRTVLDHTVLLQERGWQAAWWLVTINQGPRVAFRIQKLAIKSLEKLFIHSFIHSNK